MKVSILEADFSIDKRLTIKSVRQVSCVVEDSRFGGTGRTFSAPKLESRTVDVCGKTGFRFGRLLDCDDVDELDDENFFDGNVEYFTLMSFSFDFDVGSKSHAFSELCSSVRLSQVSSSNSFRAEIENENNLRRLNFTSSSL